MSFASSLTHPSGSILSNAYPARLSPAYHKTLLLGRVHSSKTVSNRPPASVCQSIRQLQCKAAASADRSSLKIVIQGRNLKVTEAIRDFVEEKVTRATQYYESAVKEVDVTLSVSGGDRGAGAKKQKTEITIFTLRNGVVRAEDVEENLYASIEKVADIVARKLRKMKEKAIGKGKWSGRAGPRGVKVSEGLPEEVESDEEDIDLSATPQLAFSDDIFRTKTVSLAPMTAEDAVSQVEMLGHDFLLYVDKESNRVQLLYKRKSRGYGILIPETPRL